jgi:hypothetical protein
MFLSLLLLRFLVASVRLAGPTVPFLSRVDAPAVVTLPMLESLVMGFEPSDFLEAVGKYFFAAIGRLLQVFSACVLKRDVSKHTQQVRARMARQVGDCLGVLR